MLSRRLGSVLKSSNAFRFAVPAPSYAQQRRGKASYLLNSVETDELQRLDTQHRMNLHMLHQKILHPEIPKDLERVADVATGNATWLLDLVKSRKGDSNSSNIKTKYTGFDITPSLFPKAETAPEVADIDFAVHDFFKPFPEEQLGKYDLVHIRHLSLALPVKQLDVAVKHVTSLLKPGGYIQWEEYDYEDQLAACPPCTMTTTWHVILNWVADRGYSLRFSDIIRDELKTQGMEVVEKKQFSTRGLPFCEDHKLTLLYAFDTGVPRMCLRTKGLGDEEVEKAIGECLEEWEKGVLLDYFLSRILARKPLDS
ncbi:S-adenosyl-L-methionine-dependent methyltransferase [Aspergillus karnatakaensis]|uniref:class I SAM-dependent methyltransferase n=1 Tax=Aspergillus karnatakaensis TaxID=1810916 RepID=UPI003CCCB721